MKKVLFTVLAICIVFVASAQITKGTVLPGASSNAGYNSLDDDAGGYSIFTIGGTVGYFVMDNLALGISIDYQKIDDASETSIGAFGRYYFNGKVFAGLGYTSTTVDLGSFGDATVTTIPIEVGYAAFINNFIAVEPALNYSIYGGDGDGSSFGLNVGLTVYLGRGE